MDLDLKKKKTTFYKKTIKKIDGMALNETKCKKKITMQQKSFFFFPILVVLCFKGF